jgi:SHS2 domain-containing protein
MASYNYIDHTADVLFEAEGSSLPELFEQCALAVEDTQIELKEFGTSEMREITGNDKSVENLLFDFLDDLLFYKDSEMILFSKFDVSIEEKDGEYHLKCTASGEVLDPEKHEQKVDVKAITMHMFEVKEENGVWKARVLIDI